MAALFQFNEAAFNKSVAIYKNAIPVICGVIEAYNRLGLQPFEPTDLDSIFADLNSFISPKLLALNMQESLVKESDYFKMFKCKIGDFKHYLADDGINLDFGKMSELFSFNHDQIVLKDSFIESLREQNKIYLTSEKQQKLNDFAQSFLNSCKELGIESFNYNKGEFYFSMGVEDLDKNGLIPVLKDFSVDIVERDNDQELKLETK